MKNAGAIALVVATCAAWWPRSARAEGTISYEVRQQITAVLMPRHDYAMTGMCATGTGVAPASVYARGGSGGGEGVGAGVGGRIGYHHSASPQAGRGGTWWRFRVGTGLDVNLLYARVATGIGDASGKLCARLKNEGSEVQYEGSSVLLVQLPLFLGAELGLGRPDDKNASWHGIVLGAAWAPAITYLKPWVSGGDLTATYLGAELTMDFATLQEGTGKQAGKRVAISFLVPAQDRGPVLMTLSFGAVWY